jgi:hypothetical protein
MAIVEPQTIAEPTDGHRCVHRHAVVAGVTVDDLRLDLEVLRSRIDRVRWKMEEVPPRVRVMIETPVVSESL